VSSADEDLVRLRDHLDSSYKLEGDLRREVASDIRRKVEIGCYEGLRHRRGLPVARSADEDQRGVPARVRSATVAGKKKAGKK